MIDLGVHIRIEAVFLGVGLVPRRFGLRVRQANADDRLGALESVFPRNHETKRCAILIGQRASVHAGGEQRERMHGLVEPQALRVRPVEHTRALPRHLSRVEQRRELDELCARRGLGALEHIGEREAPPRNDHRPRLHAAMPVDAIFDRRPLDEILELIVTGLVHESIDLHRPGFRAKRLGVRRGVGLARAKLVEVVVARDVLPRRGLVVLLEAVGFADGLRFLLGLALRLGARKLAERRTGAEHSSGGQKLAAIEIQ